MKKIAMFLILLLQIDLIAKDSKNAKNIKNQDSKTQDSKQNVSNIKTFPMPNLNSKEAKDILYAGVQLQFNTKIKKNIIKSNIIASKISNNLFSDSTQSCQMLFLYALKDLQEQALKTKGSKVVNISTHNITTQNIFKQNKQSKNTKKIKNFDCEVGKLFNKVILKGDIAK